ncbi:MAG: DUF3365 domain-containing protein [Gallionellaceae bacterium]
MHERTKQLFSLIAYHPRGWWGAVFFWGVLATLSYSWQYTKLETDALEMATLRGRLVFSMVQITRAWNASHGGVYAAIAPQNPANPYLKHPDKFAETRLGKQLTLINPAYMTRQINTLLAVQTDLKIHLTSLNPINPGNKADAWEQKALTSFTNGAKEESVFQGSGDTSSYRYMAPLYVEQSCLPCHAQQGYKLGDVRGGLSVSQPGSYITNMVSSQQISVLLIHIVAFILLSLVSVLSLRQNRRQISNLESAYEQRKKLADELADKLEVIEQTRGQLLQSEKMSSLGQLSAGVAHELNNPIGFVYSNMGTLQEYLHDLFIIHSAYEDLEKTLQENHPELIHIQQLKKEKSYDYIREDIPLLMEQSREGLMRMHKIVRDLKSFSHVADEDWGWADLHKGIDSTLNIVWNELKYKCQLVKEYGTLPEVYCMISQVNQVFLNLLVNAGQAIETKGFITIRSGVVGDEVWVEISDDGKGMSAEDINRIFDPFFTTKPVGVGTGLGLSLSYGIMQKHQGRIEVKSEMDQGTTMRMVLPVKPVEAIA